MKTYLFTSESVSEGHPDKVADLISDAILDALLKQDPRSRVACETLVTTNFILLSGEITTKANVNYEAIARETVREIGYTDPKIGFDANTCEVLVKLHEQSPDISQGVSEGQGLFKEQGAGDQGLMFGYASDATKELMPAPIMFAHKITQKVSELRKSGKISYLRPDNKSQVTVAYEDQTPVYIDTVVVSTQHSEEVSYEQIKKDMIQYAVKPALPEKFLTEKTKFLINPTGRFVVGGPHGDTGLTGRKIIVDTYGGMGHHGGGAFSGKDPSKVDRSACYMARYVAKNIVAAGLADRVELQVAYAIGYPEPVSLFVNTFGTGKVPHEKIENAVRQTFSFKPANIIKELDLLRPIYKQTAAYGHFGRDIFPWEKTDKTNELKKLCL